MSNTHGLTKENLLSVFPVGLRKSQKIAALGDVTAEVLARRPAEISCLSLYPRIDQLPEKLLDILARDFKVDWWDANYTLEEKRRTLKSSWRVHKHLGTKAAVDEAISAVYPNSCAKPWFEYDGGEPYHFRFEINASESTANLEKQARVLDLARYYQSLRDHLDEIRYTVEAKRPAVLRLGGGMGAAVRFAVPQVPDTYRFEDAVRTGGGGAVLPTIPVPEAPDSQTMEGAVRMGGGFSAKTSFPVPGQADNPCFRSETRMGGTYAVISAAPAAEHKED